MNDRARILIIDDEPHNVLLLKRMLTMLGHDCEGAENAIVALQKLDASYDLVLSDIMMPEMNGFKFVEAIRAKPHLENIPVIVITTLTEKEDRLKAVQAGANDFITKPIDQYELEVRVNSLLKIKSQHDELLRYQSELSEMVESRTLALQKALHSVRKSHLDTIVHLAAAAEYKDEDTGQHIRRMSSYCRILAEGLNLDPDEVDLIHRSSPMHDLGKIGIPDSILLKPGPLNPDEWTVMQTHTLIGGEILGAGDSDYVNMGAIIALSHHEKWDGTGYPTGLKGEEIPIGGRICAVADVFDALTTKRPYKEAFSTEKSLEILLQGRGTHFDPTVLDIFFERLDDILAVIDRYRD